MRTLGAALLKVQTAERLLWRMQSTPLFPRKQLVWRKCRADNRPGAQLQVPLCTRNATGGHAGKGCHLRLTQATIF
jgi:hypothetical protein